MLSLTMRRALRDCCRRAGATGLSPAASLTRGYRSMISGAVPSPSDAGHKGGLNSREAIEMEEKYSAHNYHPLPVVFSRTKDVHVWDPEGRHYLDFLSAYSAVNQGHLHPKIVKALTDQLEKSTLSSRAFYNDRFPEFAHTLSSVFGYEKVLPMNTGAEAVETGLKVAKKWAYEVKGVPENEALIVSLCGCFHGRTLAAVSMSCDNEATRGFWPLVPGQLKVDIGDVDGLRKHFEEKGDKIAAFILEPIQGEAGVLVPPEGYLKAVRELCTKHNVLMIADEIQTGLARTGRMLACDWEDVRPDIVLLGKALGGGILPVSAVLADDAIMSVIRPGEHGSTFGGNPLAAAVAIASLDVLESEELAERAARLGTIFREQLERVQARFPSMITTVRGRGLLTAVVFNPEGLGGGVSAYDVCVGLKERGILAKPTHDTIVRLAPPLTISEAHLTDCAAAIEAVLEHDLAGLRRQVEGRAPHAPPQPCDRCGRTLYKMPETDL